MDAVNYSTEAELIAFLVGTDVYVLDKDELALAGATLLRLLAEGYPITPDVLPLILRRCP